MILTPDHPLLLLSKDFADLCRPLELFQINHFTYQKQFDDGSRISLSNKPQWIADYYNLALYQTSLFEKKPSEYKSGFNIWIGDYDLEVYRHGRQNYNTAHSITITEPQHDSNENYLFSTPNDKQQAIHFLANNMDILYHFILFLKDRGRHIFKAAEKNKLNLYQSFQFDTQKSKYIDDKNFYQEMMALKKLFYTNTPVQRYVFEKGEHKGVKLSHRELNCLIYLLQNKTAKETAQLMNLSCRTVESYFNNIKNKLNCENKIELVQKFKYDKLSFAMPTK